MRKICTKCKQSLDKRHFTKDKYANDGLACWCRACKKRWRQSDSGKLASKLGSQKFKEKVGSPTKYYQKYAKRASLKYKYGLTLEQHRDMYIKQNGCCLLCQKPIPYKQICVDHNHETGKIRGLLCSGCNVKLAWFENRQIIILDYLKE